MILISHPSRAFEGARLLYTSRDAHLLAVTRTPMKCAARRLREEDWADDTVIVIRDAAGVAPDISSTIAEALA